MRNIIDAQGFYRGIATTKTILKEGEKEVPFPPDESFLKAQWNGTEYIEAAEEEILNNRDVPQLVPLWCLRQELQEQNLFDLAVQKINDLEEPFKSRALNFLEYGNFVYRNSPTIEMLGTLLQMNKIEIDTLFINADKINL